MNSNLNNYNIKINIYLIQKYLILKYFYIYKLYKYNLICQIIIVI